MTPDDAPIPEDDAIARAARRALRRLADHTRTGGWGEVRSGARRLRRKRLATVAAACAIVLTGAGAAAAVAGNAGNAGTAPITQTGDVASTTTTATPTSTTATTEPATTTSVSALPAATVPSTVEPTTTSTPTPAAQPADFVGTLSLASSTLVAGAPATVTLTIKNVSDHPVTPPTGSVFLGAYIDDQDVAGFGGPAAESTFAPGEQRTMATTLAPRPELIGTDGISAVFLTPFEMVGVARGGGTGTSMPGIAEVPITVVPPGWVPGDPPDPAQGSWKAEVSAFVTQVVVGGTVAVHATLTNTGDRPQNTAGYGSLALACDDARLADHDTGRLADATTVAPGAQATFSFDYRPSPYFLGTVSCWVGIQFAQDGYTEQHVGLDSDSVTITVLPAGSTTTTTTTTLPATTTSTTS